MKQKLTTRGSIFFAIKNGLWHASNVRRWLTGCCGEIILAVGMRFSGPYRCKELAVVERIKIGENV